MPAAEHTEDSRDSSQGKPPVVPVDDYVRDELYPGYKQAFGSQPFVAGPVRPFSKADNARYWLRDSLHFSEGMVPASIATLDDAQTWGAQLGGPELPTMLGTIPDTVPDPIMIEVFGLSGHFLETLKAEPAEVTELRGFPASKGVVEGVARVITSVTGEVLVVPQPVEPVPHPHRRRPAGLLARATCAVNSGTSTPRRGRTDITHSSRSRGTHISPQDWPPASL